MLEHHPNVVVPVEALVCHGNILYYSQGRHLFQCTDQISSCIHTFPHHVHLLKSINDTLYIAAGIKLYKLCKDRALYEEICIMPPDRILDVYIHQQNLYCITAHAHLHNITSNTVYKLTEHLLLFSACIGVYEDELTVALGTIFSGVLLVRIRDDALFIYKQLQGHKGSVYGIAMNNEIVASVSDDRNLLIYKKDVKKGIKCTGHDARVWKVAFHGSSFILTISEDSKCCVWDMDNGKLISSFNHPSGKVGLISLTMNALFIIAGAYDGSIIRWPISEIDKTPNVIIHDTELVVKNFCILNGKMIIITNDGIVYWEGIKIYQHEDLVSYTVLHPCDDENTLLIGTKNGTIHSIKDQQFQHIMNFHEKINAIFTEGHYVCIQAGKDAIVTFGGLNNVIWKLEITVTAFAVIDDSIIMGERNGSIFFHGEHSIQLNDKNDAITCIESMPNCIRIIDRSGMMSYVSKEEHSIMSQTRPLTDVTIERSNGDLLYGFHHKHFFVYSIDEHHELFRVFCAGQHRRWQLCLKSNLFAFLREGRIYSVPIGFVKKDVMRRGMHQREIRDALVVDERFVITVGEDNDVFINDVIRNIIHKQPVVHTSGIKCIQGHKGQILTAGGGYEIWEWNFKIDNDDKPRLIPYKRLNVPTESDCRILSIDTDFSGNMILIGSSDGQIRSHRRMNEEFTTISTISHGDNCVQHVKIISNNVYISAGSDGRLCYFKESSLIAQLKVHQSGINCLDIIEKDDKTFLVTGGDDQNISICKIEQDSLNLVCNFKAHPTAVNGIATFFKGNTLFIISIGLDRFVSLHRYDIIDSHERIMTIGRFKVDIADAVVLRLFSHDSTSVRVFVGGVGCGTYDIPINA